MYSKVVIIVVDVVFLKLKSFSFQVLDEMPVPYKLPSFNTAIDAERNTSINNEVSEQQLITANSSTSIPVQTFYSSMSWSLVTQIDLNYGLNTESIPLAQLPQSLIRLEYEWNSQNGLTTTVTKHSLFSSIWIWIARFWFSCPSLVWFKRGNRSIPFRSKYQ